MRLFRLLLAAQLLSAAPLTAQYVTRPDLAWRTVKTEHFDIHYTAEVEAWALDLATRVESMREAVGALVGHAPTRRVTVLVDDPLNVPNGFALALIDSPVMFLFPTPPSPSWSIGSYREWPEMLTVHEFAHLAHLTRPSRNPWERRLLTVLPFRLGPITRRAPSWVIEGYATLIEGRLTGSGRPHGVWRPAVIRQWALEGRLPSYQALDALGDFRGGEMRYLVGSAFLEWLVAREELGDTSLVHLWRRLTARESRTFAEAFAGVFGAPPDELYGRFVAEVTAQAVAVERAIGEEGGRDGELVQRFARETGPPSVSRDGRRLVLVVDAREGPSRVVVLETAEDTALARRVRERRAEILRRDPEDVPAVDRQPLPHRVLASLYPRGGRAHLEPRFLGDGRRVLVVRNEPLAAGGWRRDLFVWDTESGAVRRVTHGEGIARADPAPDGAMAVAERCRGGHCDVVLVDLRSGDVRVLLAGSTRASYYRPRFSPDGRTVVVSEHRGGVWRLALVPASGGEPRVLDAGGASRYDAAFLRDGRSLVFISERAGVPNIETLSLDAPDAMPVALTDLTGAALAPEPAPGDTVYFLRLSSRGFQLHRVRADASVSLAPRPPLPGSVVLARGVVATDTFAVGRVASPQSYGLGPRGFRLLPGSQASADGWGVLLSLGNFDPVGRFTVLAQAAAGSAAAWRGGALRASYRRWPVDLSGELFGGGDRPSRQDAERIAPPDLDADYFGGALFAEWSARGTGRLTAARAGGSVHRVVPRLGDEVTRALAVAELRQDRLQTPGLLAFTQSLAVQGTAGRTADAGWHRLRASGALGVTFRGRGLRGEAEFARTSRDAPSFERVLVGGSAPLLFDEAILSQRLAMPAVPLRIVGGRQALTARLSIVGPMVEPFAWAAWGGEPLGHPYRVVGLETRELTAPVPYARVPELRIRTGVAYTLDSPERHRLRGYGTLVLRP